MKTALEAHRTAIGAAKRLLRTWLCLAAVLLPACSSIESKSKAGADHQSLAGPVDGTSAEAIATSADNASAGGLTRGVNLTAGVVGTMVKTYTTDPFVRPVSTVKSLGFLVKNSVSDFTKRVYINTLRLPAVKAKPIPPLYQGPGMDLDAWERELDRITGSSSSIGTLEFLVDGDAFFPEFMEQIESAEHSIQLRTYIFDNDDFAVQIADLLKKRSRDVEVTVLMDGFGTLTGAHVVPASMPDTHEPPGSIARYLETDSKVKAREMNNPWFTGDHSKVAIIDRKVAFLGGMNIGREYRYDWHDLMVRVEGPVVEQLARDADAAWAQSGFWGDLADMFKKEQPAEFRGTDDGYPVRVLSTRAENSQIYKAKIAAIRNARRYIYMQNPYFSDDVILYELIKARRRGVDVRFVISNGGDHPLMDMSNARVINEMIENGIRVFVYPKMTHTKAAVIDGWLTVGSANLDHLSMRVNNEVNLATSDPRAVQGLIERLFEPDFAVSEELTEEIPTQLAHWLAEIWADAFM